MAPFDLDVIGLELQRRQPEIVKKGAASWTVRLIRSYSPLCFSCRRYGNAARFEQSGLRTRLSYRFAGMLKESAAECERARELDPGGKLNRSALNTYLFTLAATASSSKACPGTTIPP